MRRVSLAVFASVTTLAAGPALAQAPQVEVTVLAAPPVAGAALLALDALGTAGQVEADLRASLDRRSPAPIPAAALRSQA